MKQFLAGPNDEGVRLSRFVLRITQGLPQAQLHKSFRKRRIKVNGHRAEPGYRLASGDVIELYLNDEYFTAAAAPSPLPGAGLPLPEYGTAYEDASIAILYKPAGLLSHSDETRHPGLLEAYTAQLIAQGQFNPAKENIFSPALCNRLDRGTEGLLVVAKSAAALRDMNALIRSRQLQKHYLCICAARPPEGTHSAWLARNKGAKTVTVTPKEAPTAHPIHTGIQVLDEAAGLSLCEIDLQTGRTHQIRAHLAYLGAPILGDAKYGTPAINRRFGAHAQLLCAWKLLFPPGLPEDNSLAYLAGKSFIATQATLPAQWKKLKASASL